MEKTKATPPSDTDSPATVTDQQALADETGCEERLAAILENAQEGIVVAAGGRLLSVNPFMERLSGYDTATLLSQPFTDFLHPEDRETVLASHTRRLAGQYASTSQIFRVVAKTGGVHWVRASSARIEWEGRPASLSFLTDITSERRAQAALSELIANQDAVIASRTSSLLEANQQLQRVIEQHERARRSLEEANVRLLREIDEHERTARKLKAAEQKATQAARAKSVFLANMSHEIRTPLTVILGMADMALRPDSQDHIDQVRALEMIREAGTSLRGLLGDLLDLSRVEAGRLDLETIPFSPRRMLAAVIDGQALLAAKRGVRLTGEVAPSVPEAVLGDPGRLAQVLRNLVSNALKFTPQGSVTVTVQPVTRRRDHPNGQAFVTLLFSVRDTGIGIPQEKQKAIFENFRQADDSVSRQFGGTGLGLAICRRLVGLMGGRIRVKSQPGVGSEFSFTSRFEPTDATACDDGPCGQSKPAPETAPLSVLLAEDSDLGAEMITAFLTPRGHHVIRASDGHEALSTLSLQRFDLILMDIQMPGMDGLTAITHIRQGQVPGVDPDIPIVALTAHGSATDRDRILAAGASQYLAKPVNLDQLLEAMADLVGRPVHATPPRATSSVPAAPVPTDDSLTAGRETALANLGGDTALYERLLSVFARDTPHDIELLREALARGDIDAITLQAHALKGNAGVIGAETAQTLARDVEYAARCGRVEALPALGEALFTALDRVLAALAARGTVPAP